MFKTLYNYFKNKRFILAIIILSVFSIALYTALKIKPVEDISKMIPVDEELERFNFASKHIKINDRIIINIYSATDSDKLIPDSLINFADSLESNLNKNYSEHIADISNSVTENVMSEVYEIFYKYLPVFLEEEDYKKIDSLLIENSINKTLEANLKNLISPASIISKKYIKKDPLSLTAIALKKLKNLQFDDNYQIYDNHILTKDKRNLLMFVSSKYSNDETGKNKLLITGIKETINELNLTQKNINAELFGAPVISVGNAERIKKDILLTVSIAIIVLFLFLTFFYKRFEVFFVIFLPAAFGAAVSIAIINLIQGEVSVISLGVGCILVGISIDYALHIFTHFRSREKPEQIFKDIAAPIIISSLTTASAFLCLLFVSSDALKDLGLFAGISVISAALFALVVLPHFLRKKKDNKGNFKSEFNFIEKLASYNFHKNKYLIIAVVLVSIVSIFIFQKAEFESDMDSMNYMTDELKIAEKNLDEISSDALRKMYLVSTGKNLNEALKVNDVLIEKIKSLNKSGIIKSYSSVNTFLISDSLQNIRINRWNKYWDENKIQKLKDDLIRTGIIYGFKENAFSEFYVFLEKKAHSINDSTVNKLSDIFGKDLITVNDELCSAVTLLKLEQKDKPVVYDAVNTGKNIFIVDKKYITDKIVLILKDDFNLLVMISLSVVFIILLLYFGRIELTLITIIPMIVSWLWTLSIMWIFGIKFTIFNIIISTFIFGLGIDYSIFITRGLLQKYRYGVRNLPSYKTSVLLSALTTITAIGVLIFAKHPAMRSIAFLSVIGISSVVFVTYTLQPVLFNFLIKQQGKKRTLPVTFKDFFFSILIFLIFVIGSLFSVIFRGLLVVIPIRKDRKKLIFHYWLVLTSKAIVYIPVNVKKIINNPYKETFKKPAVIIANHQAHIDIPLILMLHPKILVLTNDWVQKNIFYGKIVKYADYYSTSNGFEKNLELLKQKVSKGYSILIFPEGSRSVNSEIKRFHKGAFKYAEELDLEILPIIIQGAGDCVPKGEPFLKSGQITVNILKRINIKENGKSERENAKIVRKHMNEEYVKIREKHETPNYFRKRLIANYIYKTPVLEHYTRIKTKFEKNYKMFDELLPKSGQITDIGCGYGYLSYMLCFCSPERKITGIDYDYQKIATANHNISINKNLNFICEDVLEADLPESDAVVLNDVLHYMPKEDQKKTILKCINNLKPKGKIIIRDGNPEMSKKHKGTKLSEFFSTKLLKFNKTNYNKLHFASKQEIMNIISEYNFDISIIDETKFTSNIVYVLKKL
ncbi:MAG: MMPL family transporter [Bacteroidales bacterium]|nr:MMPL family transporter [Bacteroidales bacterium]